MHEQSASAEELVALRAAVLRDHDQLVRMGPKRRSVRVARGLKRLHLSWVADPVVFGAGSLADPRRSPMTGPEILVAKAAVGPIITTAHKTAKEAADKANDARLTDLERTLANLKAAEAAIGGLGREWEDLLRTAASCPLSL